MERFAKRKVKIMSGRSGNKLVFFIEDSGVKHFVAEYGKRLSDEVIYHDVKNNWHKRMTDKEECEVNVKDFYNLAKVMLSDTYGSCMSSHGVQDEDDT